MGTHDDLIVFSHLRWDSPFQRPQHLLSHAACDRRVFFVEEPALGGIKARLDIQTTPEGVIVVRPMLPPGIDNLVIPQHVRALLEQMLATYRIGQYVLCFYSPLAMAYARDLEPMAVVYDCLDGLCNWPHEPASVLAYEAQLLAAADVVVTGGDVAPWDELWACMHARIEDAIDFRFGNRLTRIAV